MPAGHNDLWASENVTSWSLKAHANWTQWSFFASGKNIFNSEFLYETSFDYIYIATISHYYLLMVSTVTHYVSGEKSSW